MAFEARRAAPGFDEPGGGRGRAKPSGRGTARFTAPTDEPCTTSRCRRAWAPSLLVPEVAVWLTGLLNLHGSVMPVVDLRRRLGHAAKELDLEDFLVLVRGLEQDIVLAG